MLNVIAALLISHGVPPQTLQIIETPGTGSTKLVGVTFGALISTDDACTWHWVCDKSVGYDATERPVWYLSPAGTLFAATYSGLYRSSDHGCSWAINDALAKTGAADITGSGTTLYTATGKFGEANGVFRSTDDGLTFTRTAITQTVEYFTSVRLSGARVYVGSWYYDPQLIALYVSNDSGDSFTRTELTTVLPVKGLFTVHAIDPASVDTLYGSVYDDSVMPQVSHVFKSTDAGKTWVKLFSAPGRVTQVSLSPVLIAVGNSVFRDRPDGGFEALPSPTFNACVYRIDGHVLACGSVPFDGYAIAELTDGGVTPWLQWDRILGPQTCPAGTAGADTCPVAWPVEVNELGIEDAGLPACAPPVLVKPTPTTCSCDAVPGALGLLAMALLVNRYSRLSRRLP